MDGVEIRFKDDEVEKEREEEDKKINLNTISKINADLESIMVPNSV